MKPPLRRLRRQTSDVEEGDETATPVLAIHARCGTVRNRMVWRKAHGVGMADGSPPLAAEQQGRRSSIGQGRHWQYDQLIRTSNSISLN